MSRTARQWFLYTGAVVATALAVWNLSTVIVPTPTPGPTSTTTANTSPSASGRVSIVRHGSTYTEAAVSLSRERRPQAFARGAGVVYLAPHDALAFGVTALTLGDGPVFFVPRSGTIDSSIAYEIERLNPSRIIVCGGPTILAQDVVAQLARGRPTSFLGTSNRYETNYSMAQLPSPSADPRTRWLRFVTDGFDDAANAIAASMQGRQPFFLSPTNQATRSALATLMRGAELRLLPLVSSERLPVGLVQSTAGRGNIVQTLDASTPTRTSIEAADALRDVLLLKYGSDPISTVYVANQEQPLLAASVGMMPQARLVLLPPDGSTPTELLEAIRRYRPTRVVAVGDPQSVPNRSLQQIAQVAQSSAVGNTAESPTP